MSETLKPPRLDVYHVFLASPGEMDEQRQVVRQFFEEHNRLSASMLGVRFEVVDWENYSTAGVGRPQQLITQQTLEKFRNSLALVIGIMGQRFGSPTGARESGTEEEFEWAFRSHQETGWPEMKWFFRKVDEFKAPSDRKRLSEALEQWEKVCAFREQLEKEKTLYFKEFTDTANFREVLRQDLSLWLNAQERPWASRVEETKELALPTPTVTVDASASSVLIAAQYEALLRQYLNHVISRNRYLQLQGIRSGGRLVHIELEQIYITLKATRTRTVEAEEAWLDEERQFAPGEIYKGQPLPRTETVVVKVEEALAEHPHLVVLGDPGSGKTTLLRYLALCYARDRAEGLTLVRDRLGLPESGFIPILLPLRNLGAYLSAHYPQDDGTEGHERLLAFLRAYLQGERIEVPQDFFDGDLKTGRVALFFDGMDEVGDFDLRRRVARLIESFAAAYASCRFVVTSRIVGYTGAARLGDGFATTTVRDFTFADVKEFLTHWHRLVAIGQMGPSESAEHFAAEQTRQLTEAIETNPRVRELAINPLLLTVIALVHRDRVKLPERRAELYAEAVDVLLGKWDEARGVQETRVLDNRPFDMGDRRLLLQSLAFALHEKGQKEIEAAELQSRLRTEFVTMALDAQAARRAVERFLDVVRERTGLLAEAGQGVYRFSHLTFQEYLAAVEVAERDDYVPYTLKHTADVFWRETILLEAGYLSLKSRAKTTRLIKAVADATKEPEPFHNLVLAAECIRDVGSTRLEGDLETAVVQRIREELEKPLPGETLKSTLRRRGKRQEPEVSRRAFILRRIAAATALSRIESGTFGAQSQYWSLPYGEPEWVNVSAGEFWMGSEKGTKYEKPVHRVVVSEFCIARTLVTNAQYLLYVQAEGVPPPRHWEDGKPPKEKLNHPVVYVSWDEARGYCAWLSQMTGKTVRLPTEAEWEKAARGEKDQREYPWGDEFDVMKCNSAKLNLNSTTPVGVFPSGVSLYGCLDMSGNVWEWVNDWFDEAYYQKSPGEDPRGPKRGKYRVLRGGSWGGDPRALRVSGRSWGGPGFRGGGVGFRCAQ